MSHNITCQLYLNKTGKEKFSGLNNDVGDKKDRSRNGIQNYKEVSPHTSQNGRHQKTYKQQMLERVWRKGNPLALLVGM